MTRRGLGGRGERPARKHGGARRRLWRKIHDRVDDQTLEIRAGGNTGSGLGDPPFDAANGMRIVPAEPERRRSAPQAGVNARER